jgi:hypothetical protein
MSNTNNGYYTDNFTTTYGKYISIKITNDGTVNGIYYCSNSQGCSANNNTYYPLQYDNTNKYIYITINGTKWYGFINNIFLKFTTNVNSALKFDKVTN